MEVKPAFSDSLEIKITEHSFGFRGNIELEQKGFLAVATTGVNGLYRAWHQRLNKTWKAGSAGVCTIVSLMFLAFITYSNVKISYNRVITG